jgi:predicted transcriptional regulator
MLNMTASLVGSLELAIMECFWDNGSQTSGDILATLREERRTIAATTVTTTLARLVEQGLLTRELEAGRKMPWRYTARYRSRAALLAGTLVQLAAHLGADHRDLAEALTALRGGAR